jgi:hypothetical protein
MTKQSNILQVVGGSSGMMTQGNITTMSDILRIGAIVRWIFNIRNNQLEWIDIIEELIQN